MAASSSTQKLKQLVRVAPDQSAGIQSSIDSVEDQISELTDEASAMETGITDPNKAQAIVILETIILIDKGGDYISYGSSFGDISWSPKGNLTDWQVIKLITPVPPPILPPVPTPIYTYTPGDYPDLDILVTDYAFVNDYLTRPLYASGLPTEASYGIYPTIVNLNLGKTYLTNNKAKVDASVDVFDRYI